MAGEQPIILSCTSVNIYWGPALAKIPEKFWDYEGDKDSGFRLKESALKWWSIIMNIFSLMVFQVLEFCYVSFIILLQSNF